MREDDILAFARATVKSIWALELLLLMQRTLERGWTSEELVRELRASTLVVHEALRQLLTAGLLAADQTDQFCYRPASEHLGALVSEMQSLYRAKPLTVINAIASAPNEKLRIFADAFRLKD
ncbi:MAG TPA: hypothetical protein VLC74_07295 [Rhizomicrobium sp.]|nr:hypothetical protein [Rhizomicrobium sp.]